MTIKTAVKKFIPHFALDAYHYMLAFLGAVAYGFPSQKIIVIGVTGTSGKSTTVDFITRIFEENGEKIASLSSVRFKIEEKEWKNQLKMTMPGRFKIQKFLKQAADAGCKCVILEVTSEGIKQFRHKFINFHTAVFNNLSPEHIESHGGFENYRNAKLQLFKTTKHAHILNLDDKNVEYFLQIPAKEKWGFGIEEQEARVRAENIGSVDDALEFNIQNTKFKIPVLGKFNIYNALAAIAVAQSRGISLEVCKRALEKVSGISGRMEIVSRDPFVVVDYAHTPDQLEQAYKSLQGKNLICVLGSCGGGRDKWKRPALGKIAQQYCKEIIITNEDPYDEDPLEIMEQIAAGTSNDISPNNYHIVLDRKEAIKKAITSANPGDAVIITGKGSEVWMCLADSKKIPWSDVEVAKEALGSLLF